MISTTKTLRHKIHFTAEDAEDAEGAEGIKDIRLFRHRFTPIKTDISLKESVKSVQISVEKYSHAKAQRRRETGYQDFNHKDSKAQRG